MAVATSTAMAAAKIMGIANAVVAVISMIKMTPVIGARTTAAKNVDMPTIANAIGERSAAGTSALIDSAIRAPVSAPTTSSGAKSPPAVPNE